MKKVFIISLSFVIVLLSFAFCFADGGSPVILPVSEDGSSGLTVTFDDGRTRIYSANTSPVYLAFATIDGVDKILVFSDSSANVFLKSGNTVNTWTLTDHSNGYYYYITSSLPFSESPYYIDGDFSSVDELISYIDNSVFSTTFDLTYLIDGSVSWISSMAQAVKDNGLLLFFVLFIFVGVGIGLLKRFSN